MSKVAKTTVKDFFARDDVKKKFQELLGKKAPGFLTSVLQVVASGNLVDSEPASVYNACMVAATLDLPINQNLGFAYIVAYSGKASFQMGYKGFLQLAQRSGQFKTISATPIYDGQIKESNPLTGYVFDFTKKSEVVVGYAAYFKLLNGFEKTLYMTKDELTKHAKKYSQIFKKTNGGLWATDFDAMAQKTVIKLLLSKFAPLSIEMQKAITVDQAVIKNEAGDDIEYIDHEIVTSEVKAEEVKQTTAKAMEKITEKKGAEATANSEVVKMEGEVTLAEGEKKDETLFD